MSAKFDRQDLLSGRDPIANEIAAWFIARGWEDRSFRNCLSKPYALSHATIWIEYAVDMGRYYFDSMFVSEGGNVLDRMTFIPEDLTPEALEGWLETFLVNVETQIGASFAGRFLMSPEERSRLAIVGTGTDRSKLSFVAGAK